jgi:hypothetical protein
MRLLLEIIIAAALIALAWEKSWKERVSEAPWLGDKLTTTQNHPRSSTLNPRPTATVSGAWMWDPKRKATLDPPSKTHPTATPH